MKCEICNKEIKEFQLILLRKEALFSCIECQLCWLCQINDFNDIDLYLDFLGTKYIKKMSKTKYKIMKCPKCNVELFRLRDSSLADWSCPKCNKLFNGGTMVEVKK